MVTNRSDEQIAGAVGSGVSWILAAAGWGLADVQMMVAIASGCCAMVVSLATLWFMFKKRGKP